VTRNLIERIALITDFGPGIYPGQVRGRLSGLVPETPVIDLVHDLTPFRPDLAAYLLPALVRDMPGGTLYLCVVDPGVGGERAGLAVQAGADWFVGPDNGLLSRIVARAEQPRVCRIDWRPTGVSASFHGRDWFAAVGARLVQSDQGGLAGLEPGQILGHDWPEDLPAVVYVDAFGNLLCGLRAASYCRTDPMVAASRTLHRARTFCEVPPGEPFWFENALGLVEIAVNQGRADRLLGLAPGDTIVPPAVPAG
jgi:S-adenosyl-L-methionine hydrolase (adenosine-forming)